MAICVGRSRNWTERSSMLKIDSEFLQIQVCSVHFRQGRPSSDPSHEDFVPHLYLNQEPPPEIISYLESLADTKTSDTMKLPKSSPAPEQSSPRAVELSAGKKPSILKRKRKAISNRPISISNASHIPIGAIDEEVKTNFFCYFKSSLWNSKWYKILECCWYEASH